MNHQAHLKNHSSGAGLDVSHRIDRRMSVLLGQHAMLTLTLGLLSMLFGSMLFASVASGSARDETVSVLQSIEARSSGTSVRVEVLGSDGRVLGDGAALRIGDQFSYRFASREGGYLTALHVDTHGAATLLYPRANPEDGRVAAGASVAVPGPNDGF